MIDVGDAAPDFTVPMAGGDAYDDVSGFTLSGALGEGPVVLAFFPAAFTSGCTEEMCSFRDDFAAFRGLDAAIYGISADLPFAQNVWIDRHDLPFPMLSDQHHEAIEAYGVVRRDMYDLVTAARRAVFVLDADGNVTYRWVREGDNPEFDAFVDEVREAVAAAVR